MRTISLSSAPHPSLPPRHTPPPIIIATCATGACQPRQTLRGVRLLIVEVLYSRQFCACLHAFLCINNSDGVSQSVDRAQVLLHGPTRFKNHSFIGFTKTSVNQRLDGCEPPEANQGAWSRRYAGDQGEEPADETPARSPAGYRPPQRR
jgi:hypothetical protein